MTIEVMRQRLRFRSWHRGTREVDLLLGSFADRYLASFSLEQLGHYDALLQENDPDLYEWIVGASLPPEQHRHEVMTLLRNHRFADGAD